MDFFQCDYFDVHLGRQQNLKRRDGLDLMLWGKMLLKEYLHLDLRKVDTVRWNTQRTGVQQKRQQNRAKDPFLGWRLGKKKHGIVVRIFLI